MFTNLFNRRGKIKTYRVPLSEVSTNKKKRYILYDYYGGYVDSGSVLAVSRYSATGIYTLAFRNGRKYELDIDAVVVHDQRNWRERFINI